MKILMILVFFILCGCMHDIIQEDRLTTELNRSFLVVQLIDEDNNGLRTFT